MISTNLLLAATMACQVSSGGPGSKLAEERLAYMKESVGIYRVHRGAGDETLKLQEEPAFRLGKQYTDVLEGTIFFWVDRDSRPEAAAQIFMIQNASHPQGLWIHSFTSLSTEPVAAEREGRTVWNPATPGVAFQPVPGAGKPAESPAQRLRQMRAMARDFRASDNFGKLGWIELRLLSTPIARYGRPGTNVQDGALFAFAEGTDPEVFLFLEARTGKVGTEWQYALAPMTVFAVKASYQGTTVWELPDRMPAKNPLKTYFDYVDKFDRP